MTRIVNFRAKPQLVAAIHAMAKERDISVSDLLREAVVSRLFATEPRRRRVSEDSVSG